MSEFAKMLRDSNKQESFGLSDIFAEEPVPLDVFVTDNKFMANPPLGPIQYEAVRHIERIYYPNLYPLMGEAFDVKKTETSIGPAGIFRNEAKPYWGDTSIRMVNFIVLQWGKGSGKDHVCRVASMRIAYLLLCLRSPQRYFEIPSQDTIHLLNVAASSGQAQQAFFNPITKAVKRGWFKDNCDPKPGMGIITWAKNIEAISGHADAETQEGLNLMLGVADEIDAFRSKEEFTHRVRQLREPTKSAEGILTMIEGSSASRFPETFKNTVISYPRYKGSIIQRLTKNARADFDTKGNKSRYYVSGPYNTWTVNPRYDKYSRIEVEGATEPIPDVESGYFTDKYAEDPVSARAIFECKPSEAINPYFRNEMAIEDCMVEMERQPLEVSYRRVQSSESISGYVWEPVYSFAPDFKAIKGAMYVMHGDLSVKGDRAGISMAHVISRVKYEDSAMLEDGTTVPVVEYRPKVKVDFVFGFSSDMSTEPPREIQISWARQLAFELRRRGFNIKLMSFDGFECLSGDTKIPLLDGTTRTMKELEGSDPFWLYSIKDGRIVPGLCSKAWSPGFRYDMVEVELDNGELVKATSDHLFMLRDGSYKVASDLSAGDSLMPLYRRHARVSPSTALYEQIWHPEADGSGKRWRFTHSMVSHYVYGPVPNGSLTHHKNFNALDNRPDNLVQMTNQEHAELHNACSSVFSDLWKDPDWREAHRKRISASRKAEIGKHVGEAASHYRHDVSFELIESVYVECVESGVRPTAVEVRSRIGCSQDVLYSRIIEAGYESWKAFRRSRETPSSNTLAQRRYKERKKAEADLNNHTVVAVRLSSPEKVYDFQVEEFHNFATSAGVFVHNSRDSMQQLEKKGIKSKRVSTDLSESPWRNLRDLMYESRIIMPKVDLLKNELLRLTRLPNGKIDHPQPGSKDLADAVACAVLGAVEVGGEESAGGEISYYEPASFEIGPALEQPIGFGQSLWGTPIGLEGFDDSNRYLM